MDVHASKYSQNQTEIDDSHTSQSQKPSNILVGNVLWCLFRLQVIWTGRHNCQSRLPHFPSVDPHHEKKTLHVTVVLNDPENVHLIFWLKYMPTKFLLHPVSQLRETHREREGKRVDEVKILHVRTPSSNKFILPWLPSLHRVTIRKQCPTSEKLYPKFATAPTGACEIKT